MKYTVINNKDVEKIFASYNDKTIRVYQAYNDTIANEAIRLKTFGESFSRNRMTWIKPSFLWMMYRSGWGQKDINQKRILAIDLKIEGFNEIVADAVLSHFDNKVYENQKVWEELLKKSEVRCQWDPERDIYGRPEERRSIQLGIKNDIVDKFINDWIVNIDDITKFVSETKNAIDKKEFDESSLPIEKEYVIEY